MRDDNRPFNFAEFFLQALPKSDSMNFRKLELEAVKPGTNGIVMVDYEDDESEFAILHRMPLIYGGNIFELNYFSMLGPISVRFGTKSKAKKFIAYAQDKVIKLAQIPIKKIPDTELLHHARQLAAIFREHNS